jgi:hypothetical protein
MKLKSTGAKIVMIRPAFGNIRHVKMVGDVYYREVTRDDVVLEGLLDEDAWERCGPQPVQEPINLAD